MPWTLAACVQNGFLIDMTTASQLVFENLVLDNMHRGGGMRFDTTLQVSRAPLATPAVETQTPRV
jgi:hypothetical protein